MVCEAQLAALSIMTQKPGKLGQTDLIFDLWSEYVTRSVHVELQVYV